MTVFPREDRSTKCVRQAYSYLSIAITDRHHRGHVAKRHFGKISWVCKLPIHLSCFRGLLALYVPVDQALLYTVILLYCYTVALSFTVQARMDSAILAYQNNQIRLSGGTGVGVDRQTLFRSGKKTEDNHPLPSAPLLQCKQEVEETVRSTFDS